jgi:hypothetical protein
MRRVLGLADASLDGCQKRSQLFREIALQIDLLTCPRMLQLQRGSVQKISSQGRPLIFSLQMTRSTV